MSTSSAAMETDSYIVLDNTVEYLEGIWNTVSILNRQTQLRFRLFNQPYASGMCVYSYAQKCVTLEVAGVVSLTSMVYNNNFQKTTVQRRCIIVKQLLYKMFYLQ